MGAGKRDRHWCTSRPLRAASGWALVGFAVWMWGAVALAQGVTYAGGAVDLGQVTEGGSPSTANITFNVGSGSVAVVSSVSALADGSPAQDFSVVSTTCSGVLTGPTTCTVQISFSPKQAGLRRGAVQVNTGLTGTATAFVRGVGMASELAFAPDAATALATVAPLAPVYYSPGSLTYDGAGNLYFNDFLNNRIMEQTPSGTISVLAALPQTMTSALAINGAGTLYVTAPSLATVFALPPGGTATPLIFSGATLISPSGVATDGSGNLYVADSTANRVIRSAPDGSSAAVLPLTGLSSPLSTPQGLAVDAYGNLYICDRGNNRLVKVVLSTGAASVVPLTGSLLYNPFGITTDAAGGVYIADTGNRRVVRVAPSGAATQIPLSNYAFLSPTGIALAGNGDLAVADNSNGVTNLIRSYPSTALVFPTPTALNQQDAADGSKSVSLQNIGNAALQLTVPAGTATNASVNNNAFTIGSTTSCPTLSASSTSASGQIAVGASCIYAITFAPTVVGSNTGTLAIQSSPTGAANPVTNTVSLQGTGSPPIVGFTVTVTPSSTYAGILTSFTVSVLNTVTVAKLYRGTITFSSTDPTAKFPGSSSYTFTAADAGVHTFSAPAGVIFGQAGTFTITVSDGTIVGTSPPVQVGPRIAPAIQLTSSQNPMFIYGSTTLTATLTVPVGVPTGSVTFYDGAAPLGTAALGSGAAGTTVASLAASFFSVGTHQVTAVYNGDGTYVTSTSPVLQEVLEDFTLKPSGALSQTIFPGNSTTYGFAVTPVNGTVFPATITYSVAGLPAGATAAFAPQSTAAGASTGSTVLTVNVGTTLVELRREQRWRETGIGAVLSACLLPLFLGRRRRKLAGLMLAMVVMLSTLGLSGCLNNQASGYFGQPVKTFTLTVTASAGALSHATTVSLTVE